MVGRCGRVVVEEEKMRREEAVGGEDGDWLDLAASCRGRECCRLCQSDEGLESRANESPDRLQ